MAERGRGEEEIRVRERFVREHLDAPRGEITAAVEAEHLRREPELRARFGRSRDYVSDITYRLMSLAEALTFARPELLLSHVNWERVYLTHLGLEERDLAASLEATHRVVSGRLPREIGELAEDYLKAALRQIGQEAAELPRGIEIGGPQSALATEYLQRLLRADREAASRLVVGAVEEGVSLQEIYLQVFQRVQHEVGRLWQTGRLNVAHEHYCTAATQYIMSRLYARVFSSAPERRHVLVATSVAGELHELGVRMVSDLLELRGWDTRYVGANTPTSSLVEIAAESRAEVIAVSATMTVHTRSVLNLIRAMRVQADLEGVKILVGGLPFNLAEGLWEQIGADAYAEDAGKAVEAAEGLVTRE